MPGQGADEARKKPPPTTPTPAPESGVMGDCQMLNIAARVTKRTQPPGST